MAGLGLTLRALWWRRGASATLLAVATVTTAAAALGPIYARAAGESTLRDQLTEAPADKTGLAYSRITDVAAKQAIDDFDRTLPLPGSLLGYPTRIHEININDSGTSSDGTVRVAFRLTYREGECAHLVLVSGRCPRAADEAIVSSRTAEGGYGWKVGATAVLDLSSVVQPGSDGTVPVGATLKVVGIYRPKDISEPFWFGRTYFNAHPYLGPKSSPDTIDTVFVDRGFWTTLFRPSNDNLLVDYPLDPQQVTLSNENRVRADVAAQTDRYLAISALETKLATGIRATLNEADHERDQLDVSTILVTAQLALLAWLVLYQVVADAAEARGNEIALAKLRGFSGLATLRFGLGEPLAILGIAVPLGILAAWIAITVMARVVLVPGIPVVPNLASLVGALIGFAGGAIAAALAARRVLTRPVLEQWRRVPQNAQPGAATFVFDLVVVAAAIAGLVALRGQGVQTAQPRPASLLGPGLLVLAVALLGVRLLPFFGRGALRPTRSSRRVGAFLAVRQVVRRPAGLRLAALLAVAIGLATFAIDGEAVASGNRSTRASLEVGTSKVFETQFSVQRTPLDIARAADPDGTWAMAAATWLPSGGTERGGVLAVDSSRLAAVAHWPSTNKVGVAQAAKLIGPALSPPIVVKATSLRAHITSVSHGPGQPPLVTVELKAPGRKPLSVRLGPLQPGDHTYTVQVPCAAGCFFQRLVLDRPIDYFGVISGTALVAGFETQTSGGAWTPLNAGLTQAGEWRAAGLQSSTDKVTSGPEGVTLVYESSGGASSAIGHEDSPKPLPILATYQAIQRSAVAGPPIMQDTNQVVAGYVEKATVDLLPVELDYGILIDIDYLRDQIPGVDGEMHWQVWVGPHAPTDALKRLTDAGLVVQNVHTEAERRDELARQGTALALLLLVACAIAGAVLAAGATALAVAVTGRRRSFELAALRAVGINRRSLLWSCVLEQLILLGTGFVLGLPTGIVAARLALPEIPEYSDVTTVPLDFHPHVLAITSFALVMFLILLATAVLAGRALMRSAVPTRLREAAP